MTDIVFNPGFGGLSSGQINGAADDAPPLTSPTTRAAGTSRILGDGSLAPITPSASAVSEPFSKQELQSIDSATKKSGLNDADANRWAYLERMSVNAGKAHSTGGERLKYDVETLQNKLRGNSTDVSAYVSAMRIHPAA
jgi:hypothetical protein